MIKQWLTMIKSLSTMTKSLLFILAWVIDVHLVHLCVNIISLTSVLSFVIWYPSEIFAGEFMVYQNETPPVYFYTRG